MTARLYVYLRIATCPFDRVAAFLPKAESMLDLGSGCGIWCHLAARRGVHVVGSDPDQTKLKWFRESASHTPEIEIREADAADTLNTAGRFDVVSLLDILYLLTVDEQQSILSRLREHLRPGGRVLVKTMDKPTGIKSQLLRAQENVAVKLLRYTHGSGVHIIGATRIAEILSQTGLEVSIHRIDESYPHPHVVVIGDVPHPT